MRSRERRCARTARDGVVQPVRVDAEASQVRPGRREAARGGARAGACTCRRRVNGAAARAARRRGGGRAARLGGVTGWAAFAGLEASGSTVWPRDGGLGYRSPWSPCTAASATQSAHGLVISQERLGPRDSRHRRSATSRSLVRSLCFEMRYARRERAGPSYSTWPRSTTSSPSTSCVALRRAHAGWTGIPQTAVMRLRACRRERWSPMETRMRLRLGARRGLPEAAANRPVFDRSGRLIGTPDLIDPDAGVVGRVRRCAAPRRRSRASRPGRKRLPAARARGLRR